MRTIKMTNGTQVTLDGDLLSVLEALYIEVTAKRELERTFEDMVREIQHLIEQMTDDERRQYLVREPVPQHRVVRERAARRLHEEADQEVAPSRRVPELPRHPLHVQLAVEHDGHALRRPDGLRLRRSLRQARPRRHAQLTASRRSGPASARPALRRDLNAGGSKFCGDCPLKLPLKKDEPPPQRDLNVAAAAVAAVHRVHRRLQHLVRPGLLRAGNRHHPHAAGRHARLRSVHARDRRGRPVARPDRLLQLRRSVPPQARDRDVRVHQVALPAHLPLHEHQRARVHRGAGRGGWCDSGIDEVTFSIDGATAGELRQVPPARRLRQGDSQSARRRPTRSGAPAATCRSSTGATSCSRTTTATRRWRARARWRPRSASIACAGSSPIIPRTCSRAASCPARRDTAAIKHEIWDDNNLGNAIPGATPRAEIDVSGPLPGLPLIARAGRPVDRPDDGPQPLDAAVPRAGQLRPPPGPPRRAALRRDGARRQPRLRTRLAARRRCRRTRRVDVPMTMTAPAETGPLRAEVRSGQRGDRLVRSLRIARRRRRRWW